MRENSTKPTLFLRIAAGLTLLFCAGHTIGGVLSRPEPGAQAAAVAAMQSHAFMVMGNQRTFWDFDVGYGITLTIVLLMKAVLLWLLAILAKTDAYRIRILFIPLFLEFIILAPVSYRYFFFGPCLFSLLIAAMLAAAYITARPGPSA